MGELPQYIIAFAAALTSLTGAVSMIWNFRRLSKMEREQAAEHAARRILDPENEHAVEIAIDQMQHQQHHWLPRHELPAEPPKGDGT